MDTRKRIARVILPGIVAGGALGAGIALGFYPPAVGVIGSILVAIAVAAGVWRVRRPEAR